MAMSTANGAEFAAADSLASSANGTRSGTIAIEGIRSPVIEAGPVGAFEAVVFVHGNPGSTWDWQSALPKVGTFARAVAFDMPGFGAADKPRDFDYTAPGYARHPGETARHTARAPRPPGAARFRWPVGPRLGRGSSPRGRKRHVHQHRRAGRLPLALVGPDLADAVAGRLFMASTTRLSMRLLLMIGNPRGLPKPYFDHMYQTFEREARRVVLKLYRNTPDPSAPMRPIVDVLRPLDLPALVIWGAHDPYIPLEFADRQRETFPRAQVVVLDDSRHWPSADNPPAVSAALLPFLRAQVAQRVAMYPETGTCSY